MPSKSRRNKKKRIKNGNDRMKKDNFIMKGSEMKNNASPGFNGTPNVNHGFVGTSNDEDIEVPAQMFTQGGKNLLMGFLSPQELEKIAVVNYYDGDSGYQRHFTDKRSMKFQGFLLGGGISPTDILLNDRENKSTEFIPNKNNSCQGILKFKKSKKVYIVDGQTRGKGYVEASKKGLDTNYKIPFILMMEKDKEENFQFGTINYEQTQVDKSQLAAAFDVSIKEGEDRYSDEQFNQGIVFAALRQAHVDEGSPLFDMFKGMPNEKPYTGSEKKDHGVLNKRRALGIKPFLSRLTHKAGAYYWLTQRHFVKGNNAEDRINVMADIMNNYYSAIKSIIPDAFEYPRDFVLLKSPGNYSLMFLLPKLLEYFKAKGMSFSKKNFSNVLYHCDILQDSNKWRSSKKTHKRKAGYIVKNYSTMGRYEELANEMYTSIMRNIEETQKK